MAKISGVWVFKEDTDFTLAPIGTFDANFVCKGNGVLYERMYVQNAGGYYFGYQYDDGGGSSGYTAYISTLNGWVNGEEYRTLDFGIDQQEIDDNLYRWIELSASLTETQTIRGVWKFDTPTIGSDAYYSLEAEFVTADGVKHSLLEVGTEAIFYDGEEVYSSGSGEWVDEYQKTIDFGSYFIEVNNGFGGFYFITTQATKQIAYYVRGNTVTNATEYELYEKSGETYTHLSTKGSNEFNVTDLVADGNEHIFCVRSTADGFNPSVYSNEVTYPLE